MKKNTLLYLAIAGVGGYFVYKKFFAGSSDSDESGTTSKSSDSDSDESESGKKVELNAGYEEDGIDRKLTKAKEILDNVKSVSEVVIRTPKGQPNVKVKRKKKSISKTRKARLYKKFAQQNCESIKKPRRKRKCQIRKSKAIKWLESNNVPYNE